MKKIYIVLDTETADLTGYVYDVAWTIADRSGTIIAEYNALVREIFTDADRMMGAFYKRRVFTHYAPMLNENTIKLESWANIVQRLASDILQYKAKIFCAYNAGFDIRVMKQTHFALAYTGTILPYAMPIIDIWQLACETKLRETDYIRMAREHGWMSEYGNIRTGAEFAFRYITRNGEFSESHTALEDARIETVILAECLRQKKRIPYNVTNANPWRLVQEKAKTI